MIGKSNIDSKQIAYNNTVAINVWKK